MGFTINTAYTLADVLKSYDPENKLHHIIDVFKDKRPILEEAVWEESNAETFHEFMQLVSKPVGYNLRIDEGYTKEGVQTIAKKEQLAMIGSRFEIDKRLLEVQRDGVAWRAQRAQLHVRGMLENWNTKFWTDSAVTDEKNVSGILTRYTPTAISAQTANEKAMGGTTNLYPVVIIKWGMDGVSLLYPKFGKNTFEEDDRGLVELSDSAGNPYPGYRSYFKFRYGIKVGDDRCVQRLYNVDATAIKSAATFEEALIEMVNNLPNTENTAIYCGRQVMTGIQQRINSKSNVYFTNADVWGRMTPTFNGIPIIRDDSLSTSESVVGA